MENKNNELHITYLFDAPCEQVFEAWTNPEILKNWYAPEGCTIDFKSIEVKVDGEFHSVIHDAVHGDCWIKGKYHEVIFPQKLVFSMILSNAQGEVVTAGEAGKTEAWPQAIITTVTFTPIGNQTTITLHQTVDETEAKNTGAHQSWFSMFDKLNATLK